MAPAQVVYTDVTNPGALRGSLFEGIAFWLSASVPQRKRFKGLIEANGGKVVATEKDADYRLVDHLKKDNAPNTYSYKFVEQSIQNGRLEDPAEHRAAPSSRANRPVGSTLIRPKETRNRFTAKDDQILYDFVKPFEDRGGAYRGNVIYQQLEEKYPQHTYQSWRNRYLKFVRDRGRPVAPGDPPPSPARTGSSLSELPAPENPPSPQMRREPAQSSRAPFSDGDKDALLAFIASMVMNGEPMDDAAWSRFAEENPHHSAEEWKAFFEQTASKKERGKPPAAADGSGKRPQRSLPPSFEGAAQPRPSQVGMLPYTVDKVQIVIPVSHEKEAPRQQTPQKARDVSLKRKRESPAQSNNRDRVSSNLKQKAGDSPDGPSGPVAQTAKRPAIPSPPQTVRSVRALPKPRLVSENSTGDSRTLVERSHRRVQVNESRRSASASSSESQTLVHKSHIRVTESRRDASESASDSEKFHTAPQFPSVRDSLSSETDEPENTSDVDTETAIQWVLSRVRSGKAANAQQATMALLCTTIDLDLADKVLPFLKRGEGIPSNMRGVWTEEDDDCLQGCEGRAIEELEKKHGKDGVMARLEYLEEYAMDSLEDG